MATKRRTTTETTRPVTDADSGIGSLLIAGFAAVGAAAIVIQLGGCAARINDSSSISDPTTSQAGFDSQSHRLGWYEIAGFGAADTAEGIRSVESRTGSGFKASNAVQVSLFPDDQFLDASEDDPSSESELVVNLAQVSFAAEGSDFDPDVSSDGEWMVFASTQHHDHPDLYRKSIDGRVVTQLTDDPSRDLMPEISPDGRQVAFSSDRGGNWDVFVMSTEGGPVTQVTFDHAHELHPTWSPDGDRLCFCRFNERGARWELWTLTVDKPGIRSFVCEGMFPRWSPDEKAERILFQRSRKRGDRLYGVWTIDLVDGDGINPTEIVAAGDAAVMHPTWSPDGSRIAYTVVAKPEDVVEGMPLEGDIWTVDARGVGRVALTSGGYRNLRPDWGSDGRVYFMSNRGGRDVIWAVSSGEAMAGIGDESDSGVASTATIAGVDTTGDLD